VVRSSEVFGHELGNPCENLRPFGGRRGWQVGILVTGLIVVVFAFWVNQVWEQIILDGATAFHIDFKVFWAAAKLALGGEPLAALDPERVNSVHKAIEIDSWMPWSYPPTFLVALTPLGTFSFPVAWIVFSIVSIAALALAVRPFCCGVVPVWLAFSLPPAVIPSLFVGQTTILWTAGLIAALACFHNGKLVLAGFFIGLLTLKPQLGIMIPFALLACAAWRTIASAVLTTLFLAVLATYVVGIEYWSGMRSMMAVHFDYIRSDIAHKQLMVSVYSILAGAGVNELLALSLQWITTGLMAAFVFVTWRNPNTSFDLRAAVLCVAIMLSTPYLWFYETGLLAPATLFLLRAGVLTRNIGGLCLAAAMWIGVTPTFFPQILENGFEISLRGTFAPIIALACIVCVHAVLQNLRKSTEPNTKFEVSQ